MSALALLPKLMKASKAALDLIKEYEGFRDEAYKDLVGRWTIGYGTTEGVTSGLKINVSLAEKLLEFDVETLAQKIEKLIRVPITQNQFDALVSFTYNLGLENFTSSTLLKKLNAKDYGGAADEFLLWDHASGKVIKGLHTRREKERALFLTLI